MADKKKIEKSIESLQKRIEEHKQKIEEYKGKKSYLVSYWEKEIKEFEKKKGEKENKLKK